MVDLGELTDLQWLYIQMMGLMYTATPQSLQTPASHFHLTNLLLVGLHVNHLFELVVSQVIGNQYFHLYLHKVSFVQVHEIS